MAKYKKIIFIIASLFITNVAYSQTQYNVFRSLIPETTNKYYLGSTTPDRVWAGLYVNQICLSGDCKTIWPTGGGGSGGGSWSTTTSQTSGILINYPNNTTDVVVIGSTSSTTAEVYFDPNNNRFQIGNTNTASTTLLGNIFFPTTSQGWSYIGSNGKLSTLSTSTLAGQVFPFTSLTGYNATSTVIGFLGGLFSTASSTFSNSLFLPNLSQGLLYNGSNGLTLTTATTSASCSGSVSCPTFTVLGASPVTITGSGGGGTGLSTSSPISDSNVLVYSASGAGSAYGIATGTLSVPTGLTVTGNRYVLNGNAVIGLDTGYVIPLQSTLDAKALGATTITVNGTANQITSSAGAQDLSANRTWTLSFPNQIIFPQYASSTLGFSTPYASSTFQTIGTLTFGGVTGSTWSSFCNSITGSAGLCDGVDDTSAGGNSLASTSPWSAGQIAMVVNNGLLTGVSTSTPTVGSSLSYSGTLGNVLGGSSGTLSINTANPNTWSALQTFNYSSTTGQATFANASSTQWIGGGLQTCNSTTGKLNWDSTTSQFRCDTDQNTGGGGGTNYLTNSGSNTYLNTGTYLQAPALEATSTTATSTFSGGLYAKGSVLISSSTPSVNGFNAWNALNIEGNIDAPFQTIIRNDSLGYSALAGLTLSNSKSTNVGLASTGYGGLYKASPYFTAFSGLPPDGLVLFNENAPLILGSTPSNTASSSIFFAVGSGYALGNYDMALRNNNAGFASFGIGTTSPMARLTVNGANGDQQPIFIVASSTATATTTKLAVTNKGNIALGTTTQNGGEVLDEVFAKSLMVDDMSLACDIGSAVTVTADGNLACGWYYAEDGAGGQVSFTNSPTGGGYTYGRYIDTTTSGGSGVFVPGDQTGWIGVATNTPILETNFRISDPTLATSTVYYIGFGNINYAGATFDSMPTNYIGFIASSSQANWQAVTKNNTVTLQTDTGIASTTNITGVGNFRRFRVESSFDTAKFYIQSAGGAMSLITTHTGTSVPDDVADVLNAGVWFGRVDGGGNAGFDAYKLRFNAKLPLPTWSN